MPRLTCAPKSANGPHLSHFKARWALLLLGSGLLGCSTSRDHGPLLGSGDETGIGQPGGLGCETPNQGCDCKTQGEVVDCGRVERVSGQYISCAMGQRSCDQGQWGACIGDRIATLNIPPGQRRSQALGTGVDCPDNPCDPYCRVVVDNATDLPQPDGGPFGDQGGLHVLPHLEAGSGGVCSAMQIQPSPQALTVTGFGGGGLRGEYFKRIDMAAPQISPAWVPDFTRNDANIDFDWSSTPPPAGIVGSFSIRWTGIFVPKTSEPYTICAVPGADGATDKTEFNSSIAWASAIVSVGVAPPPMRTPPEVTCRLRTLATARSTRGRICGLSRNAAPSGPTLSARRRL